LNPWEKGIWYFTIGLTAAVLFKLWFTGLVKIYRLLFLYLATDCISSVAGLFIPFRSAAYGYYYFSAQTVKIVIAAFMLMEIYALALEGHPALAQFGRNTVGYILAAAGAFPLIGLLLDHSAAAGTHPYIRTFFSFEQTIDGMMAMFLILISLFMTWFPVRMRRNVIVYIGGFIAWTLSRAALAYVIPHWFNNRQMRVAGNIIQMGVDMVCLLAWLLELKSEGESRTAVVGHLWNRAEAERLTQQLDAINDGLARFRRR
jgi:hypothetical protein